MTAATLSNERIPGRRRTIAIAAGVVVLHAGVLYALQGGLVRRVVEVVVPVAIVSELITPPQPRPQPPAPEVEPPPSPPAPPPSRPVAKRQPAPPPAPAAPRPRAAPALPPAPSAPVVALEPQPAPSPLTAPVAAAPAPAVPPAPAPPAAPAAPAPAPTPVELPSSSADYLQNPPPAYPPMSRRLGERGTVVVRVLIGADGTAKDAEIRTSSGYERLDRAALETVRKWRYVPGKRGGVPEAMWHNVPVNFVLE